MAQGILVDQLDLLLQYFSYTKGKDIVASHGYNNLYVLQDKSIASFRLKHTKLVPEAYLYAGEKNNVRYYILLSPIDGEIETEKIGDGNYLDKYFQMKYGAVTSEETEVKLVKPRGATYHFSVDSKEYNGGL